MKCDCVLIDFVMVTLVTTSSSAFNAKMRKATPQDIQMIFNSGEIHGGRTSDTDFKLIPASSEMDFHVVQHTKPRLDVIRVQP